MRYSTLTALAVFELYATRGTLSESKVLELVNSTLPHSGVLKKTSNFLYVDIDDAYIHQIALLIKEEGFSTPPYFDNIELVGAHISVAYPEEIENFTEIAECGTKIEFIPKRCEIIRLTKESSFFQNVEEVYLLIIEAPELDRMREKYGLPKRRYAFHITVGVK